MDHSLNRGTASLADHRTKQGTVFVGVREHLMAEGQHPLIEAAALGERDPLPLL